MFMSPATLAMVGDNQIGGRLDFLAIASSFADWASDG
jgi:hypothetical protein